MEISGEKRSTSYLMQVIGMAIQRGNSACILETVSDSRKMDSTTCKHLAITFSLFIIS